MAEKEGQRDANCFDRRVNATTSGESLDLLNRLSVLAVHRLCGAETPRHFEAILIEIDHDDFRRRIELCGEKRGEADRTGADDRDGRARFDFTVEDPTFKAGRQDIT